MRGAQRRWLAVVEIVPMRIPLGVLALALLLCLGSLQGRAADVQTLTVFAAASLHNAFADIAAKFEAAHPGVNVRSNFDGSQILETQLANGAPADVFASADTRWMNKAADAGLVTTPVNFAGNSLVAITQIDEDVHSLRDITRNGLKIAICAEAVPCGRYTRIALDKMSADPHFWKDYAKQVMRNVVTQEQNVEAIVTKINLGEVDVGFVYASDVVQKSGVRSRSLVIPDEDQELATYPIAVVKGSANEKLARAFLEFVLSADGQTVLRGYGFRSHT